MATPHPEKISVFSPDWAPKGERSGQNRPVVLITRPQPLSRFNFELAVNLVANYFHQPGQVS